MTKLSNLFMSKQEPYARVLDFLKFFEYAVKKAKAKEKSSAKDKFG